MLALERWETAVSVNMLVHTCVKASRVLGVLVCEATTFSTLCAWLGYPQRTVMD